MDLTVLALLVQDGMTNGAVYALLAVAIVLVFAVTRVIHVPQGEYVTLGALTLAHLQARQLPGAVWLLLLLAVLATCAEAWSRWRRDGQERLTGSVRHLAVPLAVAGVAAVAAPLDWPLWAQSVLAVAIVAPMGPLVHRIVFQPLTDAPVLTLLVASVATHIVLAGLILVFFGAQGYRTPALTDATIEIGPVIVSGQSLVVVVVAVALMLALALFFGRTLRGRALRAAAHDRIGARIIGFSPEAAGRLSFLVAAVLGALSGVLIAPIVTIYYDSGFAIGLKGFVAAIVGGLASYPLAAAGAIGVGLLESVASFWASEYKEVIVFLMIVPVLGLLSWRERHAGGHDDE